MTFVVLEWTGTIENVMVVANPDTGIAKLFDSIEEATKELNELQNGRIVEL